ncbi:MAG: pullulanase-type alpha-1,6-glucosidase [Micropruina sp.]|nr:pullulanase-type alpha-1,6-glucosidase [Micropruina sp.]
MQSAAFQPDLRSAHAHWLTRTQIAWPADALPGGFAPASLDWRLHFSPTGGIDPRAAEPVAWGTATLRFDPHGLPTPTLTRHPHLRGHLLLRLDPGTASRAEEILRGQVAVSAHQHSGRMIHATGLQIPGVLDDLYPAAERAQLGVTWSDGQPTFRLWAPTASRVRLVIWPAHDHADHPGDYHELTREPDGCWSIAGRPEWKGCRYRYQVKVFAPHVQRVVNHQVTDPYAVGLTVNSTHGLVLDLSDPALAPAQWLSAAPPRLGHPVDQVIYELHVRDFSISDKTVPAEERGSFLAFARNGHGTRHLRRLARAGLNTVQLLPVFDNATVEEHPDRQRPASKDSLRALPPDSPEQQRVVSSSAASSGFNWGYDPLHYQAPEGSFCATHASADGAGRVTEFRTMVGALHGLGLRVVLDQVFNHTASSGQNTKSILDRIVPGYYHRLNLAGEIETSSCCPNVATEHRMAQKLMVDSCVLWARQYKIDGFRFDLMGHHSRTNMLAVRAALDALTRAKDGVDGRSITLYGEGWSFGEVAGNARFVQASQGQLGGTSIGTFSDRLRDAVRGGGAFEADPRVQGFGTGLLTADNWTGASGDPVRQRERLLWAADLVQLGLAGNLRGFEFNSAALSRVVRGDEVAYHGAGAGYADQPDEVISYVDAHDNETLFDALTLKLPRATTMGERVRMNTLCLAFATLGQSPVMWHAGTDILRSKSLDRNSYNSGDWFNFLDFSLTANGFGAGLPPQRDNGHHWELLAPMLADPALKPLPGDLRDAHAQALDLLRLRASTRLFRLASADQVKAKVTFPASGTWQQIPGVITMRIDDGEGVAVDDLYAGLVVVFNGTPHAVHQALELSGEFVLHPIQAKARDPLVRQAAWVGGAFRVPGRTVAVFVEPR